VQYTVAIDACGVGTGLSITCSQNDCGHFYILGWEAINTPTHFPNPGCSCSPVSLVYDLTINPANICSGTARVTITE
jgi:hypothetical protein